MGYDRFVFVSLFGLFSLVGCNFVTGEELTRSQADLRAEVEANASESALAVHTCAQGIGQIRQFDMVCQMFGVPAYCAAVQSYVDSCFHADENGVLTLPEPRVWERLLQAAENAPTPSEPPDDAQAPTETPTPTEGGESIQPEESDTSSDQTTQELQETEFMPTPASDTLVGPRLHSRRGSH